MCFQGRSGNEPPLISGSIGPYGAYLSDGSEFTGKYIENVTDQQLRDFHLPRLSCLIEEGVDLLAIETNPSLREVEIVMNLLKHNYPKTKAWVTFSLNINEDVSLLIIILYYLCLTILWAIIN